MRLLRLDAANSWVEEVHDLTLSCPHHQPSLPHLPRQPLHPPPPPRLPPRIHPQALLQGPVASEVIKEDTIVADIIKQQIVRREPLSFLINSRIIRSWLPLPHNRMNWLYFISIKGLG